VHRSRPRYGVWRLLSRRAVLDATYLFVWTCFAHLTMLCGWYHAISFSARAARVPLEDGAPRFRLARSMSGRVWGVPMIPGWRLVRLCRPGVVWALPRGVVALMA
jgi:hypothetical protein